MGYCWTRWVQFVAFLFSHVHIPFLFVRNECTIAYLHSHYTYTVRVQSDHSKTNTHTHTHTHTPMFIFSSNYFCCSCTANRDIPQHFAAVLPWRCHCRTRVRHYQQGGVHIQTLIQNLRILFKFDLCTQP